MCFMLNCIHSELLHWQCLGPCSVPRPDDGADYSGTYGITTSGNALTLRFVTNVPYSKNIGSRVYLLDDADHYRMFDLKNQEFTFDVDMSGLPCGLNGALYFSEMPADGGKAAHASNKVKHGFHCLILDGADLLRLKYGTGYCDAQCPHDIKWINGEVISLRKGWDRPELTFLTFQANILDWAPSSTDSNAGNGRYGACCAEMDIWEANSEATAYTPHVCRDQGLYCSSGNDCGDGNNRYGGVCDKDGCDLNSYRMGDKNFLGRGKTVDTTKKVTVVTQTVSCTRTHSRLSLHCPSATPSLTTSVSPKRLYPRDNQYFNTHGGVEKMGDAMANGMVLIMSL
ncbi:hypothetical protein PTI98_005953 [Pleurotus ostreatus]|nr:hypothetical protein PTI98_005953 [Pleurotus ostreatus]